MAAGGGLGEPYVTFLAGYRLLDQATGEVRRPAQLDDAQRVVRWVRAHADEYNVDPDRICSIGDSAGGHVAAVLGVIDTVDDSDPELAGISRRVDCAITIAGVNDMSIPLHESVRDDWYEAIPVAEIEADPSIALEASPVHHVDEDTVPMLVLHGHRDTVVPIEQSRNLADALGAAGVEYVYAELPTGHGAPQILQEQGTFELVEAFLNYQMHPVQ
ncbi:MAG: alpha/beta hydrolase [Candidatus Limnocylindrales bacterium]